jgi:hypothetical protein
MSILVPLTSVTTEFSIIKTYGIFVKKHFDKNNSNGRKRYNFTLLVLLFLKNSSESKKMSVEPKIKFIIPH